jgi:3-isopropylmalate/(R)-2-methylmalate dehydratase small subunit
MRAIRGRVYKFGDDINTDVIYPGKYLSVTTDRQETARHCFEAVYPEFLKDARAGDIIVAGRNFGCGSSREQAASCLKYFGISAVVAESFARIFYRNAINLGLPAIVAPGVTEMLEHGDTVEVDLAKGNIRNERTGKNIPSTQLPPFIMEVINEGGLINHLQKRLGTRKQGG